MRMKKWVTLLLSGLLVCSLAGCADAADGGKKEYVVPDYSACDASLVLGMFVGIPNAARVYGETGELVSVDYIEDEAFYQMYEDAKAAGFTFVMQGYGETYDNHAYAMRSLAAAEKAGVGQLIDHPALKDLLLYGSGTDEQLVRQARLLAEDYKDSPAFYGSNFRDEPLTTQLKDLGRAEKLYRQAFPGKMFYVNLLPAIAGTSVGGNVDYNGYLEEYFNNVTPGYVSYDHYPLLSEQTGKSLADTFLYNMEIVQAKAAVREVDFYTILQAIGYGANHYRPEKYSELAYQAYSALAYGAKGFQWFCYGTPPVNDGATTFTEGIIDRSGKKTDLYDQVSALHAEVRAMEKTLLSFEWKGVMTVNGRDAASKNKQFAMLADALASHKRIASLTAAQDTLVGVFRDKEARDGFFFVNQADPWTDTNDTVRVTFQDAVAAVVLTGGTEKVVELTGGKLELVLKSGEGAFVIPLKEQGK